MRRTTIFLFRWLTGGADTYEIEIRFYDENGFSGNARASITELQYKTLAPTVNEQSRTNYFFKEITP